VLFRSPQNPKTPNVVNLIFIFEIKIIKQFIIALTKISNEPHSKYQASEP
jgi:hypothetical protein